MQKLEDFENVPSYHEVVSHLSEQDLTAGDRQPTEEDKTKVHEMIDAFQRAHGLTDTVETVPLSTAS